MKKYLYLCITTTLFASQVESLPSFQGFKGIVNTPNATVYKEGEFEFLYSNEVDNILPSSYRGNNKQENYFLNMGVLPNLDLSFRYTNATDTLSNKAILSDRVVSFKYQLPFIPKDLFQVALGIQDIGGGASHLSSKYAVLSKEFKNIRTTVGYAQGDHDGSLNGAFGSVEYQPFDWLNIAGEYDTHDWNAAVKGNYVASIGQQKINLGLMARSSTEQNDVYFGLYANIPIYDKSKPMKIDTKDIPSTIAELKKYGFSNIAYRIENDILYFEYENTLYTYSDLDALGVVLGALTMSDKAKKIVVVSKKSNIKQLTVKTDTKEYKKFLTTGKFKNDLLQFSEITTSKKFDESNSDRFKPTLTLKPALVFVDGSEYASSDYTLAMQAELSMRLAKGTILSTRYNFPLAISDNFKEGHIFDYRNRNKTKAEIDQILLSQYLQIDLPYRWVTLLQLGQFDRKLTGGSVESSISSLNGNHMLIAKASQLKEGMYQNLDRYGNDEYREERLLAYQYYFEPLNANIKLTAGEFLYGDKGTMFSLERYFSDTSVRFDISKTEHEIKGDNKVARLTLSIPFGTTQKIKTKYLDIQGDYLTYNRRKTIVSEGKASYAQPHHLKEVENSFSLEKYYLNNNRFHPAYIKENYNRLRNVFIE